MISTVTIAKPLFLIIIGAALTAHLICAFVAAKSSEMDACLVAMGD